MRTIQIAALLLATTLLAGCDEDPVPFSPSTTTEFFDDFSQGNANRWSVNDGSWSVSDGRYIGFGGAASTCQGLGPNQSLVHGLQARDLDVELDMVSISGVDKALILRSSAVGDQIELNFRAERPGAFPADLVVQEISACNRSMYTAEFAVEVPHQVGQTIHVRVRLVGTQLTVWVDGTQVLDDSFPFTNVSGQVGVAFVSGRTAGFDNVKVKILDT